ncbi:LysM domain-containing protein [Janibacter terrae]|uniref:LysM peptidoglycan-binding domain-containing protein n=1 Tax=Janibacter terrae TaxID=103817 RepID=UPI0031F8B322
MRRTTTVALAGAGLLGGAALTTATAAGTARLLDGVAATGSDPAAAVAGLASLLATLVAGWLTSCLGLSIATTLPGGLGRLARRVRDRVTPAIVRRWAAVALGASVTATVLPGTAVAAVRLEHGDPPSPGWGATSRTTPTPTTADATSLPSPGWSAPGPRVTVTAPAAGWTPHRPVRRQRTDPTLLTGRQRDASGPEVVVRRGDTLWSIAAAHLGPGASDAEVAEAWPRWHLANAELIGPDPHILLPGTQLQAPSDTTRATVPATKGRP